MSILVQTEIQENLFRKTKRFLQMNLWVIPPPQGFTPEQSLGITGRPYIPLIQAPQMENLSGSALPDMIFNNTGEIMHFNNNSEEMEFNNE